MSWWHRWRRPARPTIESVCLYHVGSTLRKGKRPTMLNYSVQASTPAAGVASRNLSVAINGAAPSVVPLASGFACEPGDSVTLTLTDVSAGGVPSQPSSPFSFTAVDTITAPATPSISGVTLVSVIADPSPTPTPSPAPAPASS